MTCRATWSLLPNLAARSSDFPAGRSTRARPGISPPSALSARNKMGWAPLEPGEEPTWLFAKVPEPKTAKNRLHLDLAAPDPDAEIVRLVGLGATRVADTDGGSGYRWSVMTDPEGK